MKIVFRLFILDTQNDSYAIRQNSSLFYSKNVEQILLILPICFNWTAVYLVMSGKLTHVF